MLFTLLLVLASVAVVADIIHYFRLRRHHPGRHCLFIAWAAATDSLPLIIAVCGWVLKDNSTQFMLFSMWLFWAWIVTVIPRLVYYFFNFIRLPRVGIALALCFAAAFVWGATRGRTNIRVNRVDICSERIPASFDGLRIVQLSDIHIGTIVRPERELQRIVDSVEALKPDLIVFSGDLVNIRSTELDHPAAQILRRLKAHYGVISVMGNHDVGAYIIDTATLPRDVSCKQVIDWQRSIGWQVLNDTTVYLVRGADSLSLSGIAFDAGIRDRRHDRNLEATNLNEIYRGVPDSLFNITVVHLPQLWEQITEAGYGDLTLSGHVHSMQMKLNLFGRSYSPAQWLYDRWSGRYDENGRTLYINDGTGYVAYPMRLGAYPEITLFTLRRCE